LQNQIENARALDAEDDTIDFSDVPTEQKASFSSNWLVDGLGTQEVKESTAFIDIENEKKMQTNFELNTAAVAAK